jgi:hypothetical protein
MEHKDGHDGHMHWLLQTSCSRQIVTKTKMFYIYDYEIPRLVNFIYFLLQFLEEKMLEFN